MTPEDIAVISKLADALKERGVRSFTGSGIHLEFGLEDAKVTASQQADVCRCGCPLYAHTNGLCIHGCAPEACAPEEA